MVYTLEVANVNEALKKGLELIQLEGEEQDSRNGPVLSLTKPLATTYHFPCERVLFSQIRKCNPFFHFFESFWILSGSNKVKFLTPFLPRMSEYSDDGRTLNGAYGYRMTAHFDVDQLLNTITRLRLNPNDRRIVIQLFDAKKDLTQDSKDIPCNIALIPRVTGALLDLTVINRSNDMIWGAYGANAVHFSYVQEFLACALGLGVGALHQFSTNTHIYTELPVTKRCLAKIDQICDDRYQVLGSAEQISPSLFTDKDDYDYFLADCDMLVNGLRGRPEHYNTSYFQDVVCPILEAFHQYKRNSPLTALEDCQDRAWALNIQEWVENQPM